MVLLVRGEGGGPPGPPPLLGCETDRGGEGGPGDPGRPARWDDGSRRTLRPGLRARDGGLSKSVRSAARQRPAAHARSRSTDSPALTATGTTFAPPRSAGRPPAPGGSSSGSRPRSNLDRRGGPGPGPGRTASYTSVRSAPSPRFWAGRGRSRVGGQRASSLPGSFSSRPLGTVRATCRCIRLSGFTTDGGPTHYDLDSTFGPS